MSNNKMGRPKKGKDRRIDVKVYITGSVLETIDDYVAERQQERRGYSRSDFFNAAVEKYMQDLGLAEREDNNGNEK